MPAPLPVSLLTRCSGFPSLLTISTEGLLNLYIAGILQHNNDKGCLYHLFEKPLVSCLVADKIRQTGGNVDSVLYQFANSI